MEQTQTTEFLKIHSRSVALTLPARSCRQMRWDCRSLAWPKVVLASATAWNWLHIHYLFCVLARRVFIYV